MKKYRVEFNTTGFYQGQGVFEVLDETSEVEATNAQEAIESVIEWMIDFEATAYPDDVRDLNAPNYIYNENGEVDRSRIEEHIKSYAWIAKEILYDENGEQLTDDYNIPLYGEVKTL